MLLPKEARAFLKILEGKSLEEQLQFCRIMMVRRYPPGPSEKGSKGSVSRQTPDGYHVMTLFDSSGGQLPYKQLREWAYTIGHELGHIVIWYRLRGRYRTIRAEEAFCERFGHEWAAASRNRALAVETLRNIFADPKCEEWQIPKPPTS